MPSPTLRSLLALAATCLLPAASHAGFWRDLGQYGEDRADDFIDIFRLRAGVPTDGDGYGLKVRATAIAQVGFVHYTGVYAGLDRRGIGVTDERRVEGGLSLAYGSYNEMEALHGNDFLKATTLWSEVEERRILRNLPYWDDGRGHFLSVGGEIATPIIAFDIGVYPEEAFDFVTSFFCIDPFHDDQLWIRKNRPEAPSTKPEPDLDASTKAKKEKLDELKQAWEKKEAEKAIEAPPAVESPATPEVAPVEPEAKPVEGSETITPEQIELLRKGDSPEVEKVTTPLAKESKAPEKQPEPAKK